MKEFRFIVEFEDGSCDFRSSKGSNSESAKQSLSNTLNKQHESPIIKGKKAIKVEVQQ